MYLCRPANLIPILPGSEEYTLLSELLESYGLPYDVLFINADATLNTSVMIHTFIHDAHILYNIVFDKDFEDTELRYVIIHSTDSDNRIQACNQTAIEMLSAAKLLGKQFWFRLGDIAFM